VSRLVLLHGAGGGPALWDAVARRLPGLDAPALPGHGDGGEGRDTIDGYGRWVADRLAGQPAVVGGSSMGGAIALWLALERPALVEGLVLIGTGGRLRVDPGIFDLLEGDHAEACAVLARRQLREGAARATVERSADVMGHVPATVTAGDYRACDRFDVLDRLGDITVPTLVLVGAEDRMTPLRYAERLADGIPGGCLVVIPRAGHLPMVERPKETAAAIAGFLEALDSRAEGSEGSR
jgi:pimeloyl-ACP methyl ester carboxylesterase